MDSDGSVAYEGPRGAGFNDPRANPSAAAALNSSSFLTDGQWHMVSLTTQTNTSQGFRCARAARAAVGAAHVYASSPAIGMAQDIGTARKVAAMLCASDTRSLPHPVCMRCSCWSAGRSLRKDSPQQLQSCCACSGLKQVAWFCARDPFC